MKNIVSVVLTIVIMFVLLSNSFAQENRIQTDRPDQTENPFVVPPNSFQFEAGFVLEKTTQDGITIKNLSYPSALLRYGIMNNLELRMEVEHVNVTTEANGLSSSINGITPVSLGIKMNACEESGLRPAVGLIVHFSLPNFASPEFKNNFAGTSVNLTMENGITDKLSAGYNFGASWDGNTPEPTFFYTLALGYEITNRVTGFAEAYGFMPEKTRADHRFNFGLSVFALNNLSLDVSAGIGITDNAPDYFVNGGFSFRLPK